MKTLFDQNTQAEIDSRLNQLTANSQRQWGKMSVSQMLKHIDIAFSVPIKKVKLPKEGLAYLAANPIARKLMIDILPWPKNMMTADSFIIKTDPEFEKAKADFLTTYHAFLNSNDFSGSHPAFGVMDKATWGKAMYKHLDHHLRQFGV